MIKQLLSKPVASNMAVGHALQACMSIAACFVMIFGIRRLAEMELTEAQVFVSSLAVMSLVGVFLILAFVSKVALKASRD